MMYQHRAPAKTLFLFVVAFMVMGQLPATPGGNKDSVALRRKQDSLALRRKQDSLALRQQQDSAQEAARLEEKLKPLKEKIRALTAAHRQDSTALATANESATHRKPSWRRWLWPGVAAMTGLLSLVLFLILTVLSSKLRKMKAENKRQQELAQQYTAPIDALYAYLIGRKILTPSRTHFTDISLVNKIDAVREKMEELIEKYYREEDLAPAPSPADVAARADVPVANALPATYIKAEVMLSAGPRKEAQGQDTELGEDVAGTLQLPGQTFFWLLDGTSDSTSIDGGEESHIFSSRLLAQNIGYHIQKHIAQFARSGEAWKKLVEQASATVLQEWVKRINQATPDKKAAIVRLFEKGFKPACSTTLLMGRLTVTGRLETLRIGDSKLFPFLRNNDTGQLEIVRDYAFSKDPTTESDRIAFRLDYAREDGQFSIRTNDPRCMTAVADEVSSLFVFSDGIGRVTEIQLASNNPGIVEMIRQNIGHIPQKTYDDKSLIVLERIVNS